MPGCGNERLSHQADQSRRSAAGVVRALPTGGVRPNHALANAESLFDEAALLARTDNDNAFARELIELFLHSARATLAQLDDAVRDAADPVAIRKLAHSLKGSAATAAAGALVAGAADLERVAGSRQEAAALSSLQATFALTTEEWARRGWTAVSPRLSGESR